MVNASINAGNYTTAQFTKARNSNDIVHTIVVLIKSNERSTAIPLEYIDLHIINYY